MNIGAVIFFALGAVFNIMGNLGVLIFPDVYTRLQASSTCSTTSVLSFLFGCMFLVGLGPMLGRLLVITMFFFVTSPISAHIIARFAWQNGMVTWRKSYRKVRRRERPNG
ncbi:MAG: monovalent cation/H(+) antiporter subunit G [Candidatus Fermentibacteraceae bacterium]|nr:monovalent cation/H(+) antiporter subunit G [Candidatus Fermentibacteraceae bacterium]